MSDEPSNDLPLRTFMHSRVPAEEAGLQLSKLVGTYGDDACMKAACEALSTDYAALLIRADANCHQEITYEAGLGEKRKGSLIDYSIAVAHSRRTECPEDLLKLLLGRGVEAAPDCNHPTIVRYRTALSPNTQFTQATYALPSLGELGAKAASAAFRVIGSFSPFAEKRDLKI